MKIRLGTMQLYLAVGFLTVTGAIALITGIAAERQNAQFLASQKIVADFEVQDSYEYLGGQVRQMVYWQDTFNNTIRKWDQDWVTYQFGRYQETMGNRRVALIGPDGDVRFLTFPSGSENTTGKEFLSAKGMHALLTKVRRAGVHQPPPMIRGAVVIAGRTYYAVASLITPELKSSLSEAIRTPVIAVFLKPAYASSFDEFTASFQSDDIHIATGGPLIDSYRQYSIDDAEGHPVAWLRWHPRLPGDNFIQMVALPLMAILLLFMIIQGLVITRWLTLQRQIFRAEADASAAQEQSRLKSVFLGTISHELRTPLNAIIGYADVLCMKMFGPLGSARNEEYIHDIRTSGAHLLKAVNDLIEIARIEARDTGTAEEVFDVATAVRQAIRSVHERAEIRKVRVALFRPECHVCSRGSLVSLSRAVERLLSNAIRYSPEGSRVEVDITDLRNEVRIEITDHGCGIDKERLADLTRPFGHPDNHLIATSSKGMGFGIPIAKGLVQLMGGTLTISSKPGLGTRVRICLPAETASPTIATASEQESHSPGVFWRSHHPPKKTVGVDG